MRELAVDGIPVAVTCRVLKLCRQDYYRWRDQPVTDALLLGAPADAQVLVSRSGVTTHAELSEAAKLLDTNGGRSLGVVTTFEQPKGKKYGHYGYRETDRVRESAPVG